MKNFNILIAVSWTILALGASCALAEETAPSLAATPEEIVKEVEQEHFGKTYTFKGHEGCRQGQWSTVFEASLKEVKSYSYSDFLSAWDSYLNTAKSALIAKMTSNLPGWSNSTLVSSRLQSLVIVDDSKAMFDWDAKTVYCTDHRLTLRANTVRFKLTPQGETLLRLVIPQGAGVEVSMIGLGNALNSIKLVPSQKKVLKSFFDAAQRLYDALQVEREKAAKGERARPVEHRAFMEQASLLVAYHRFLKDGLEEAAQLSSEYFGTDSTNVAAVNAINTAVKNLEERYGLESDEVTSRKIADYGLVLSDLLLNQFAPLVEEAKRARLIRPMMGLLADMVAMSAARGDGSARSMAFQFKSLWEAPEFTSFMTEWLTTSDRRINGLVLNLNSLAYKIGLAANVPVKVFEKDDLEKLKPGKKK